MGKNRCDATGKKIFDTKSKAIDTMIRLRERNRFLKDGRRYKHREGKPAQRRAYYCYYCKGFHLTKMVKYKFSRISIKIYQHIIQLNLIIAQND